MRQHLMAWALAVVGFGAQAQAVVTLLPGSGPNGQIPCNTFGVCSNVPNSAGANLTIAGGYTVAGVQHAEVIYNGVKYEGAYAPVLTSLSGGLIAQRVYDATLQDPVSMATLRLQMTTFAHAARCNARIASGCAYLRILPPPTVGQITFN